MSIEKPPADTTSAPPPAKVEVGDVTPDMVVHPSPTPVPPEPIPDPPK